MAKFMIALALIAMVALTQARPRLRQVYEFPGVDPAVGEPTQPLPNPVIVIRRGQNEGGGGSTSFGLGGGKILQYGSVSNPRREGPKEIQAQSLWNILFGR